MAGKSFFMHKNSAGLCTNSLHKSALLFCNKHRNTRFITTEQRGIRILTLRPNRSCIRLPRTTFPSKPLLYEASNKRRLHYKC